MFKQLFEGSKWEVSPGDMVYTLNPGHTVTLYFDYDGDVMVHIQDKKLHREAIMQPQSAKDINKGLAKIAKKYKISLPLVTDDDIGEAM